MNYVSAFRTSSPAFYTIWIYIHVHACFCSEICIDNYIVDRLDDDVGDEDFNFQTFIDPDKTDCMMMKAVNSSRRSCYRSGRQRKWEGVVLVTF